MPHITEELNAIIFGGQESYNSIHRRGNWPKADLIQDETAEKTGDELVRILEEVRKYKSEKGVSIKFPASNTDTVTTDASIIPFLEKAKPDLLSVTSSAAASFASGPTFTVTIHMPDKEQTA